MPVEREGGGGRTTPGGGGGGGGGGEKTRLLKLPDELGESRDSGLETSASLSGSCLCVKQEGRYEKLREELAFKEVMIAALQESNQCLRLRVAAAENKAAELRLVCERHCSCCARTFWPKDPHEKMKKWEESLDEGEMDDIKPCFTSTPSKDGGVSPERPEEERAPAGEWKRAEEERVPVAEWRRAEEERVPVTEWRRAEEERVPVTEWRRGEEDTARRGTSSAEESSKVKGRERSSGGCRVESEGRRLSGEGWRLGVEGWRKTQEPWSPPISPQEELPKPSFDWRYSRGGERVVREGEAVDVDLYGGGVEDERGRRVRLEQRVGGVTHFSLVGDQGVSITLSPTISPRQRQESAASCESPTGGYRARGSKPTRSDWRTSYGYEEEKPSAGQGFRPWAPPSRSGAGGVEGWKRGAETEGRPLLRTVAPPFARKTSQSPLRPTTGRSQGWNKLYECLDEADDYARKLAQGLSRIPSRRP